MIFGPYIVPVVGMLIPIVAIIGGIWGKAHGDRLRADQRMAMLARGLPLAEIEAVLKPSDSDVYGNTKLPRDPMSSLGRARRTAVVLISVGFGVILFFALLELILRDREVLAGAACGLIPLAIGIGFVVDYQLQKRELARFGLEIDAEPQHKL